jgi:membrane protein DedA with SNARE-associated domain
VLNEISEFIVLHSPLFLAAVVFIEQLGAPVPAIPIMISAGALAKFGKFNLLYGFPLTVVACVVADLIWFYLGRLYGAKVLGLLCQISIEPDYCIRKTKGTFTKYGLWMLVFSKFVPGLSTLAPPLVSITRVKLSSFLLVDTVGAFLYVGICLGLGYIFNNQIEMLRVMIENMGGSAIEALGVCVVDFAGSKFCDIKNR